MKRQRVFHIVFVTVTICGALIFWRYLKTPPTPQIEVTEKPVAYAKIKSKLSSAVIAAIENSDSLTLYSLYYKSFSNISEAKKWFRELEPTLPPVKELFHGYAVLGMTELHGSRKNAALKAFYTGINESRAWALCFCPRHALRVQRSGKVTDFVICFECQQFLINPTQGYEEEKAVAIANSPQPVFDALLTEAGITLAPI